MSIDRIGTASNAQLMLAQIQKAEVAVDTANRQVSTGKVADTYTGYADKTAVMDALLAPSAPERRSWQRGFFVAQPRHTA